MVVKIKILYVHVNETGKDNHTKIITHLLNQYIDYVDSYNILYQLLHVHI